MHHFAGYLVKNQNGDVVQYSPHRQLAEQFCQQNGFAPGNIVQIYEWKKVEYTEADPVVTSDDPIDLQPIQ